ncbi:MAG: LysR family transcriptional regulator [Pseudomonadota bacterium]|nr:LysR family transcriptional regulator [Pseudomonadota bacterium]
MDQLAALRAFVGIVETGSFTRAAATLGVPKPTVSKLVQHLEAHLNTKLLSRTTRRLAVTSDGAAYYERALQILSDLDELDASLTASQAKPKGKLRIDVSSSIAQSIIIPALSKFFTKYPDIQLDIGASDRQADLVADNVDCVIRAGVIGDLSLIARRIAELHMTTCAAPAYLDVYGTPEHPSDLERDHLVVGYLKWRHAEPHPLSFTRGAETLQITGRYRAAVNEAQTYLATALAGHGIIQVPSFMVRDHLISGAMRPVLPDWQVPGLPLHVVYPPNRHLSMRLRVFVDWTAQLFAAASSRSVGPARIVGIG